MNADGSSKVQITHGDGHSVAPTFAGNRFYLDDEQPTPQIVFAGAAHGWRNEQAAGPAFALYGTDVEGKTVRRLTFNLHSDVSPDVLPSGRIVFTSWQRYGDRFQPDGLFALMDVNVDGTDLMPFYGNHEGPPYKDMATVSSADDRVYFIESDRVSWLGGGDIAVVSRRRPLHSYRRLSHDGKGWYHSPRPLPNGGLLASYRSDNDDAVFAVYRMDPESGRRQRNVFEEPGWHSVDTQVLAPHPTVRGRANWLIPGATTGVFYSLNSYRTNLTEGGSAAPGTIKYVRVIEGMPVKASPGRPAVHADLESSAGSVFGARRLLGIAPVEDDGSFHVRVPAEIPITFQLLDADYVALRTQRAWTWVIGNENRGCIGCHEDRELSPPNKLVTAVTKAPVALTLPPERRRTVDFRNNIAPIVQAKCATAGCHVAGQVTPSLEADGGGRQLYEVLLGTISGRHDGRFIVPGSARRSPLIWLLFGRQIDAGATVHNRDVTRMPAHDVLSTRERILLVEWVDLGAQWDTWDASRP
jgi:hypothetical protein